VWTPARPDPRVAPAALAGPPAAHIAGPARGPSLVPLRVRSELDPNLLEQVTDTTDLLQLGWAYWSWKYYDDPTEAPTRRWHRRPGPSPDRHRPVSYLPPGHRRVPSAYSFDPDPARSPSPTSGPPPRALQRSSSWRGRTTRTAIAPPSTAAPSTRRRGRPTSSWTTPRVRHGAGEHHGRLLAADAAPAVSLAEVTGLRRGCWPTGRNPTKFVGNRRNKK